MFSRATTLLLLSACSLRIASAATVMAHFMVQNAFAYDHEQWKTDIKAAQQVGIDGFAMNWMPPDCQGGLGWQVDRIDDAYTAAEEMGFKMMHSFDMSWSQCDVYWNTTYMADAVQRTAGSSATYRWNSNILVSTYGGESVDQYGNDFFENFKRQMRDSGNAISFAPALTTYAHHAQDNPESASRELLQNFSSIDGFFNWQAWPLDSESNSTCTADEAFQQALKSAGKTGPYIMAVSPWQYKDLNNGNPMDAWVAYSDYLLPQRMAQLAQNEVQPDIIELLTWNDFCESHYLRNLPSLDDVNAKDYVVLGDMQAYVRDMNHEPWRIIAKYYIEWWKTGRAPHVHMDQVVYWYRVHPRDADCSRGMSTGIRNSDMPADAVIAWALVKDQATINVSIGENSVSFEANGSGPQMATVEFPNNIPYEGVTPEASIVRNGETVQSGQGSRAVSSSCDMANFNPVVNLVGEGINRR